MADGAVCGGRPRVIALAPRACVFQNGLACAAGGNNGLHLVSVTNPAAPWLVSTVGSLSQSGYSAQAVAGQGRYAFLGGAGADGLAVIDVGNPAAPVELPGYASTAGDPVAVRVVNGLAFVGEHNWSGGQGEVTVFDVGNPRQPRQLGYAFADGYLRDLEVAGNHVFVAQSDSSLKVFRIDFTGGTAPALTQHPQSVGLTAGQTAAFAAAASGDPVPRLQWQRSTNGGASWLDLSEGAGFSGTDSTNLVVDTAFSMNGHQFRAVAASALGTNTSSAAVLTVNGAPLITGHPQGSRVNYGRNAILSVTNVGAPLLVYQWLFNGAALAGQTNTTLNLSNVTTGAEGHYSVRISNGYGTATSLEAVLHVNNVVAWGYNPVGQTIVPSGLSGAVAIAAGANHNLALRSDGTVIAWGYNDGGQTNVPAGLNNVVGLAGGEKFSLALQSDHSLATWGTNNNTPATVPTGLTNVVAISAQEDWSMALRANGTVTTWGYNGERQRNVPSGLSNVVMIACGDNHTLALQGNPAEVVNQLHVERSPDGFLLSLPTLEGHRHTVEYADSLAVPTWKALAVVRGYGLGVNRTLLDLAPASTNTCRFYRTRTQP